MYSVRHSEEHNKMSDHRIHWVNCLIPAYILLMYILIYVHTVIIFQTETDK